MNTPELLAPAGDWDALRAAVRIAVGGPAMIATISFEVTVRPHESGAFVATCPDFPRKVGIGLTEAEAVVALRAHVLRPTPEPIRPVEDAGNPWAGLAEAFRDTPLDDWRQELADRRRQMDAEREAS